MCLIERFPGSFKEKSWMVSQLSWYMSIFTIIYIATLFEMQTLNFWIWKIFDIECVLRATHSDFDPISGGRGRVGGVKRKKISFLKIIYQRKQIYNMWWLIFGGEITIIIVFSSVLFQGRNNKDYRLKLFRCEITIIIFNSPRNNENCNILVISSFGPRNNGNYRHFATEITKILLLFRSEKTIIFVVSPLK